MNSQSSSLSASSTERRISRKCGRSQAVSENWKQMGEMLAERGAGIQLVIRRIRRR